MDRLRMALCAVCALVALGAALLQPVNAAMLQPDAALSAFPVAGGAGASLLEVTTTEGATDAVQAATGTRVRVLRRHGMELTTSVMERTGAVQPQGRHENLKRVWDYPPDAKNGGSTIVLDNLNSLEAWEAPPQIASKSVINSIKAAYNRELDQEEKQKKALADKHNRELAALAAKAQKAASKASQESQKAEEAKVVIRPDLKVFTPRKGLVLRKPLQFPAFADQSAPSYSYAFWINPLATNNQWAQIFQKGDLWNQRSPGVWLIPDTSKLHVRSSTAANWNDGVNTATALPLNEWTHVAFSHKKGEMKVYLNGVLTDTNTKIDAPLPNDGALWSCRGEGENEAKVQLTDVRYYPRVLTADEVKAMFDQKKYKANLSS